jgi:hypothetical protein
MLLVYINVYITMNIVQNHTASVMMVRPLVPVGVKMNVVVILASQKSRARLMMDTPFVLIVRKGNIAIIINVQCAAVMPYIILEQTSSLQSCLTGF